MEHLNPPDSARRLRRRRRRSRWCTAEGLDRLLDYRAPAGGARPGDLVEVPLGPRRVLGAGLGRRAGRLRRRASCATSPRVLDAPPLAPAMRDFLARAADYTLTPLPVMLRLATRAPGLGAPPAARPLLRRSGREPDRMTERAGAGARRLRRVRQPRLRADASSRSSPASRRRCVKGLEAQGVLVREDAPRDAPYPAARPRRRPAPAVAGAGRGRGARCAPRSRPGATPPRCSRASPARARPRSISRRSPRRWRRGRQALVLLPEIALSVEFLDRVEARFGARPAEWHSGVTQAARRRAWTAVATGDARLVVGARSALFLPFADLGLVVVDEEHDGSYKQEDGALYHARDMAVLRASIEGAAVVLASATPCAREPGPTPTPASTPGSTCPSASAWPSCRRCAPSTCARTRPSRAAGSPSRWRAAVTERLAAGEQSLLFLNRRGYAPLTICRACGHQVGCDALRRAHGRAPLPQAPGLPPVRRDQADPDRPARPARSRGRMTDPRPRRRAAGRGGGGALARGAARHPVLRPRRRAAGAEGAHRRDRRAAAPTW